MDRRCEDCPADRREVEGNGDEDPSRKDWGVEKLDKADSGVPPKAERGVSRDMSFGDSRAADLRISIPTKYLNVGSDTSSDVDGTLEIVLEGGRKALMRLIIFRRQEPLDFSSG